MKSSTRLPLEAYFIGKIKIFVLASRPYFLVLLAGLSVFFSKFSLFVVLFSAGGSCIAH